MPGLAPQQIATLERLTAQGFRVLALPLYANAIGVRKGNCAALLLPAEGGGMQLVGAPSYLVESNLSVRVTQGGRDWFVWKTKRIEATPERQVELERFTSELIASLHPPV